MQGKNNFKNEGDRKMNNDLIERYIYAVTKRLPGKTREDVARELRTLIEDMLKEWCGEVTPSDKDIRVVLTELGTPNELYEQYAGDGKRCLIGPPYYTTYVFVMKIVLICVAFGMTLSAVLGFPLTITPVLMICRRCRRRSSRYQGEKPYSESGFLWFF